MDARRLMALGLAGLSACGVQRGQFDENTGLMGVAVAPGALEGTWAQMVEFANIVSLPLLGDREGGGRSARLVTVVWNPVSGTYDETFKRCTSEMYDVEGMKTLITDEAIARFSTHTYGSQVEHADGTYRSEIVPDLLGVRDLPDPQETPLPTKDNYDAEPQRDWIWDEDEDSRPGVTVHFRGTVSGRAYMCKRSLYVFEGTVLGRDRIQGLVRTQKNESNTIDATILWLKGEGSTRPNPDAKRSWFDMVRLPSRATCDEVLEATADGRLASQRPF